MSGEDKDSYYQDHNMFSQGFAFPIISDHNYNPFMFSHHHHHHHQQQEPPLQNPTELDHSSHMGFSNCLLSSAFDLSCSSSEVAMYNNNSNSNEVAVREAAGGTSSAAATADNPLTPNSSGSFSSPEAGAEEDSSKTNKDLQPKACEEEDGKSKKAKAKKKEEKKQRQPRFAFMTKSAVDNLEDGYRWRKYGQKAVKNSPFPRSYYRCTSQKCGVKKRIERSFQDPSMVITTYEGQHNHHSPATIRGNAAALLAPSLFSQPPPFPSFPHQDLFFPLTTRQDHQDSTYYPHLIDPHQQQQPPHQLPDQYGLLPDMFSSYLHKPPP